MEKHDFKVNINEGEFSFRVAALIIENGKLLIAKHIDNDCYYTVGGRVMLNETSTEAVIREVFEETGYHFKIDRLVFIQERFFEHCEKRYHEIVFFYLMEKNDNVKIIDGRFTDQGEKESLYWVHVDNLSQINLIPNFIKTRLKNIDNSIQHIITIE